jgi:hypothetical protein
MGLALAPVAVAYWRGSGVVANGLKSRWDTLFGVLPLMLAGLIADQLFTRFSESLNCKCVSMPGSWFIQSNLTHMNFT